MNYLQKLSAEKEAREKFDLDSQRLKELIFITNEYHSLYDGHFLDKMSEFLFQYKKSVTNKIHITKQV
jgi:hypothetical protein